jgi:transcriptional regulator of acetoin/glycerol metabolism
MGSEHYCQALQGLTACAVPICDDSEQVVASMVLTQPVPKKPWDTHYRKLLAYTVGLLTSIANAAESKLRYRQRYGKNPAHAIAMRQLAVQDEFEAVLDSQLGTLKESLAAAHRKGLDLLADPHNLQVASSSAENLSAATGANDGEILRLAEESAAGGENLSLRKLEEITINIALKQSNFNVASAARLLEISKATLYRKLKEYNLTH